MNKRIFITGGAGFIGTNATIYFLKKDYKVTIFDNFSREGSKKNIKWLKELKIKNLNIIKGDVVANLTVLRKEIEKTDIVIHLAGQVAVTSSVIDPRDDFNINALGTFNVLEAARVSKSKPIVLYSSTNKVYGALEGEPVMESKDRYKFKKLPNGVSEEMTTDFHSPYGCSKGAGDQYVRDYYRIYGLKTIVFRQSCIYGPRQFGIEDQGWLAWFLIAITKNKQITIYGNGKQVRDALYVDDLICAYDMAIKNISKTKGQIYNIGGGTKNTISIWKEFNPILEELFGKRISVKSSDWRPGDQPIYISDIRKAKKDFGWVPKVNIKQGTNNLYNWIQDNQELFA